MVDPTKLDQLKFRFPFRLYQKQILEQLDFSGKDRRFHIVAPPGSGKTVVGIELVKRLGKPAVVFAPNTTIQVQWKKQVGLFLPEEKQHLVDEIVSTDPKELKLINVFTYQLISTPSQNNQLLSKLALELWQSELVESRRSLSLEQAKGRIASLKKKNSRAYQRRLSSYVRRAKRRVLEDSPEKLEHMLHANARGLIESLTRHGVKTIVLDEVHHLLDYWAITIASLDGKIDDSRLVGLTATPPRSASSRELANYLSLMGDIDYQVPTPAVVKEGNLAPYQDLLYVCGPTAKEQDFIANIQFHFEEFVGSFKDDVRFNAFIEETVNKRTIRGESHYPWRDFFKKKPLLAVAGGKYITQVLGERLSGGAFFVPEMKRAIGLSDWAVLLKAYALDYLLVSDDAADYDRYRDIKAALKTFGYILTEQGIRLHRSATDSVLALSASKQEALTLIAREEMESLGDKLRMVVITDFEKASATARKRIGSVLDAEAGGAVAAFRALVHDEVATALEPIMITGKSVLMDSHEEKLILSAMREWRQQHRYEFRVVATKTDFDDIVEVKGSGKDWRSSVYTRMVTDLFESGVIRCIVGTRGLIGEGWNSIGANTLVDLTATTTYTSVNQIRGRALRLDPSWPRKLSNIWHVVCADPTFEKGDQDLERFLRKQKHFFGLSGSGAVVKGLSHVDKQLALLLETQGFKSLVASVINKRSMAKAKKRDQIYDLWRIGEPYQNITLSGLSLRASQIKFKSIHSVEATARAAAVGLATSTLGFACWLLPNLSRLGGYTNIGTYLSANWPLVWLFSIIGLQVKAGNDIRLAYKRFVSEIPVDGVVRDVVLATVLALREVGLVSKSFDEDSLEVKLDKGGQISITTKNADPKDSRVVSDAVGDVFSPVIDQRYLVSRGLGSINLGLLTPFWLPVYLVMKLFHSDKRQYHGVPDILAIKKSRAVVFVKHWHRLVGGGSLVYTRSRKGADKLLKIRSTSDHDFDKMSYETWQ